MVYVIKVSVLEEVTFELTPEHSKKKEPVIERAEGKEVQPTKSGMALTFQ